MGLLSNFRKQSAAVKADPAEETPALDFEFGDEPASDDEQWLQAVDRRKLAPSAEDVDPFLMGIESDVPAAAPTSALPTPALAAPTGPAADAPGAHDADVAAGGYAITDHAPPATLMSTTHSEPMLMAGQPDFPTEAPPEPQNEQLHPTPNFESYDLLEPEDPPVAYAYAEELPKEIVEVRPSVEARNEPQPSPLTGSEPEELPNLGMVFAGLSSHGIMAAVPPAPPMAPPAPPQVAPIDIGFGPLGPQAVPHLQTMGLTVGVSWPQVTQARRTLMEQNPADGTADQQFLRTEVNHASASLRLLRVGPLLTA